MVSGSIDTPKPDKDAAFRYNEKTSFLATSDRYLDAASELSFSLRTVIAKDETKLHWIRTSNGTYKYSCMIWTVIQFGVWILAIILLGVTNGFSIVFYGVVGVLALIALTQVRFYMRQKYSIPADCCADSCV